MQRAADYRENAKACRDLAARMPSAHRDQLLEMAKAWDALAEEREQAIRDADSSE
jgi:hypothetical protein